MTVSGSGTGDIAGRTGRWLLRSAVALCALAVSTLVQAAWFEREAAIMGTVIRVELWHTQEDAANAAIEAVLEEMRRIDRQWSPYREDSELSRLNREGADGPVTVSPELVEIIGQARAISERTRGAFDITFASVGHLYDYRRHQKPDAATVDALLPNIDYRHVVVDAAHNTVRFARPGVRIDLGGIAKGYAVDRCIALLQGRGVAHAMVSAGGDTRILGTREQLSGDDRPWMVGVRDPRREGEVIAVLPLNDMAVSTSGDYERYFDEGGQRFHHIIDPETGGSAGQVRSVTVLGPVATTTDALSTSVFVLGIEKGMVLIDAMPGYEAIIVDGTGRLLYSDGLERPAAGRP